jgi:hypothetical protein
MFLPDCACLSTINVPSEGKFVFKKEGSSYYLWQIWTPGYNVGRELPVTVSEKEQASVTEEPPVVISASLGQ